MIQKALACLSHHLRPLHTQATNSSHWDFYLSETGQMSVQCLCLHSCSSNPVLQQIAWVWFLNALFQHLESRPGAQPQTETTINSSIQNTFLRIRQPKYPWGQNDPTWAACCDWLHGDFSSDYTKDIKHNSKTVGNHGLHSVRALMSWYTFISATVMHHQPEKSPSSDTLSLLHTVHWSVRHFEIYFRMIYLVLV